MRTFGFILLAAALTACTTAKAPLSQRVAHSEMTRNPEASWIDGQEGKLKWNYTTGLELKAILDANPEKNLDYVDAWYDAIIDENGTIYKYKKSNYSQDHICPGRTLFQLYDLTGKEKYRMAMDTLYSQLQSQPRTPEGGFWHKQIYPDQMWLDGLYMAEPFYAEYTNRFVPDSLERTANYEDIVNQFVTVYDHTLDPDTGLLRHAWDSSHQMFWCNGETGQSDHAWGRAMGWYCMALVDVAEILPDGSGKDTLLEINNHSLAPERKRTAARDHNLTLLRLCKKHGTPIMLGSDAHVSFQIADYERLWPLLAETDFPDELVMNYRPERFFSYLNIPENIGDTGLPTSAPHI